MVRTILTKFLTGYMKYTPQEANEILGTYTATQLRLAMAIVAAIPACLVWNIYTSIVTLPVWVVLTPFYITLGLMVWLLVLLIIRLTKN